VAQDSSQIVRCNGVFSDRLNVSVGVPQGSVLGPFLFVIFINDISQHIGIGTANLFADDTLIYCSGNTPFEVNEKLQGCVNEVSNWYKSNNIVINADKSCCMLIQSRCKNVNDVMQISIDGDMIRNVESMPYLGLEIEENLTWDIYINKLCKKLSYKVSKLARLSKSTPRDILIKIYNATIQPCLDYALSVWGCTSQLNLSKVQRIQNYAARIIVKNFDYVNRRGIEFVYELGWMDVKERFFYFQTLLIFKCIHGYAPEYLLNNVIMAFEVSTIMTRKHPMNLYLPFPECEFHKNMLFYRGARDWNNLPDELKDCHSSDSFKRLLKLYIRRKRK
jgi:hypothetical protein